MKGPKLKVTFEDHKECCGIHTMDIKIYFKETIIKIVCCLK